jgi:hypothetical protein
VLCSKSDDALAYYAQTLTTMNTINAIVIMLTPQATHHSCVKFEEAASKRPPE